VSVLFPFGVSLFAFGVVVGMLWTIVHVDRWKP